MIETRAAAFSIGIGLTNECNLRCAHCYRPDAVVDRLGLEDVQRVCESLSVRSMNFGVGENGLHPRFAAILEEVWSRGITTSITSNGLSLRALGDGALRRFHGVEVSLDFPTEAEHDAFRGRGNWHEVMEAIARCAGLGVSVTVTAVMMSINYNRLAKLARVAAGVGAHLRVNVYQPVRSDRFALSYDQFWEGFARLLGEARLVATSEPVLVAVLGLDGVTGPGCGRSTVRVAPDGRVLPCTYWRRSRLTVAELARLREAIVDTEEFVASRRVPPACDGCPCRGGCAGRRALLDAGLRPDPYCPFVRGHRIALDWEPAPPEDLPKVASACTTVVSAR